MQTPPPMPPDSGAERPALPGNPRSWLFGIMVATAVAYAPSLGGGFLADDYDQIVHNRHIGEWSFIWKSMVNDTTWFFDPANRPLLPHYRPLHNVWIGLNYHLFGLHAARWHAATLALHLLVVWLVFRVASRLTSSSLAGLLAAAIFALMPLHTGAVVWPAAVATLLYAAFELAAFIFYLRGVSDLRDPSLNFIASFAMFAGALLSYDAAAAFPILIATHAYFFGFPEDAANSERAERVRFAFNITRPYLMVLAGWLLLRIWVLGGIGHQLNSMSTVEVALTMPIAIATYTTMLLTPWRAEPAHSLTVIDSAFAPEIYLSLALLAAIFAGVFLVFRKSRHRRLYFYCGAWTAITLAPMLNLGGLEVVSAIQNRYLYLPSVGLCVIAGGLLSDFASHSRWRTTVIEIALTVMALLFAVRIFSAERFYNNDVAYFSRCVADVPKVGYFHNRLGLAYAINGELNPARQQLEVATTLNPNDLASFDALARVNERLGDYRSAAETMAARLEKTVNPTPSEYIELALTSDAAGDSAGVDSALAKAAALPAGNEMAALTRAQILFRHNDSKGAENALRQLLSRDPANPNALATLGSILDSQKRYADALDSYRRGSSASPKVPLFHYLVAYELHNLGRDREAHDECAIAIAGDPDNIDARALMARIESSIPH
ncbi:MAG TPA: tetratricopeptide repeat protein [Candidatus Binataceae bacterium]|nr:tetratricopeptide repeat protein [Candidatus Binataceae bacterium]